jgi:hypothetical protein
MGSPGCERRPMRLRRRVTGSSMRRAPPHSSSASGSDSASRRALTSLSGKRLMRTPTSRARPVIVAGCVLPRRRMTVAVTSSGSGGWTSPSTMRGPRGDACECVDHASTRQTRLDMTTFIGNRSGRRYGKLPHGEEGDTMIRSVAALAWTVGFAPFWVSIDGANGAPPNA